MRLSLFAGAALGAMLWAGPAGAQTSDSAQRTRDPQAETIVVVGTRTPRIAFETPLSLDVIEREDIQLLQPFGFQEVFEETPGVEIQGGPRRIAGEPTIRGFSDNQIILRVDGARRNFDLAHRGRFLLDPDLVKRIEVLRGAASTVFGSGGLGGVIDVETVDGRDMLGPDAAFGGRVKAGYQTNGQEPFVSGSLFGVQGKFDALAQFLYRETFEDLEDGDGAPIIDSQDRIFDGLLKVGFEPAPDHRIEAFLNIFDSAGENPTNAEAESSPTTVVDRDTRVYDTRLSYTANPGGSRWVDLSVVGYYTRLDVAEDRFFDGRFDDSNFETLGVDANNTVRLVETEATSVRVTVGAEVFEDRQSGTRDGEDRLQFPDASRFFAAGYGQAEIDLFSGLVDVLAGVRFDHFDLDAEGAFPDRSEGELSPRVSVGLKPLDGLYIWGSWSEAFRAPSLTQLFVDGNHFVVDLGPDPTTGVSQLVVNDFIPNPFLEPEDATTFEAGARYRVDGLAFGTDRLEVSGGYFNADVEDFIDQQVIFISGPPSFTPPFGPLVFPGVTINSNENVVIEGFEGDLAYDADRISVSLSGHLVDSEVAATGAGLGSLLLNRIAARVEGRFPKWGLTVGGKVVATFDRTDVPAGVNPGEGYRTLDLFAAWRPEAGPLAGTAFALGLDNVTDSTFAIFPSELNQPGRSLRFSVTRSFGG
ncbi:MAG: TonB-dependent receptor domain-containing protein [Maricaulaceae bacterium]